MSQKACLCPFLAGAVVPISASPTADWSCNALDKLIESGVQAMVLKDSEAAKLCFGNFQQCKRWRLGQALRKSTVTLHKNVAILEIQRDG